jgi:hypothetical protein
MRAADHVIPSHSREENSLQERAVTQMQNFASWKSFCRRVIAGVAAAAVPPIVTSSN